MSKSFESLNKAISGLHFFLYIYQALLYNNFIGKPI
nr:MAG TPA: hypothetical protein [Caudoviricetes sp.]